MRISRKKFRATFEILYLGLSRERAKSGARTKKREGGGVKERKRRKLGDCRQPMTKISARPLAATVF